ncbi:hypothetical protein L208DRAFT_1052975, partial [Tricholoma matsutake]
EQESFLNPGEWMWADSAYATLACTISPFKKPAGGELTHDQHTFNYYVSRIRVQSEHVIRMLKNQFQSLKEVCFQISLQKMHHFVILWITCCLILHNLIICIEE